MRFTMRLPIVLRGMIAAGIVACGATAPSWSAMAAETKRQAAAPTSHAVIWVGLPGDDQHRRLFAAVVAHWRQWLTERLRFEPAHVHVVPSDVGRDESTVWKSTREAMEKQLASLRGSLGPRDRLWVFLLGHANADGGHAWFHVNGPDPRDDEIGKLFEDIACEEQVFWLTTPVSAHFLRALSRKGRITIAAAAAEEDNETEFPVAFCAAAKRTTEELDTNRDGRVSVRELATQVVAEVQARYAADKRLVTERAQWDDNGDGHGTELSAATDAKTPRGDGTLAEKTYLPLR